MTELNLNVDRDDVYNLEWDAATLTLTYTGLMPIAKSM